MAIEDPTERVLVLSTTNKATDEVALSIGRALREHGVAVARETACRVGSGADVERYRAQGLEELLVGGEAWLRQRMSALLREHQGARNPAARARLWSQIQQARLALSAGRTSVDDVGSRIVVATAFTGLRDLVLPEALARTGAKATFTSVILDEAGLVSRAAVAELSLLAARRVLLVGDPKQLSPISRISRVLPTKQAPWLGSSGLTGLTPGQPGMHRLSVQHRMHPDIRAVVSGYQYDGKLVDAATVHTRASLLDHTLSAAPRAIWYVLDEDTDQLSSIRAERGRGNRSWLRQRSADIMERLFKVHPGLESQQGLFVTPFVAQARALAEHLSTHPSWQVSTVHRQQGAEADVVIFDTVNASSTAWSHSEWRRLINVGISRVRHLLVVLASRSEMIEPYAARLAALLAPRVLRGSGGQIKWLDVPVVAAQHEPTRRARDVSPHSLGAQIESRKAMRPILSAEQQRLCAYPLDGKARLVRGVAGSGKTAVLAHWLARRLADSGSGGPLWVVYANAALHGLLEDSIQAAWTDLGSGAAFPWDRVKLFHVLQLLETLEAEVGLRNPWMDAYDFEARARALSVHPITPRCAALFIDEAQDFGEVTLEYLSKLVQPSASEDPTARCVNIFFDNAQNVYRRGTPQWSRLGLDMRGRSTVMKESFRSTQPSLSSP